MRYLCRRYPLKFRKKNTAQVYVTRVIQRAEDAEENGWLWTPEGLMSDRRSTRFVRNKPVTENPDVVNVVERICSMNNGNIPATLQQCRALNIKASRESLRKVAWRNGFMWQKPWHTDVLTTAQKYKRTLFCRRLLRLSNENLVRLLSVWMFTDEKWFDIVGPAPGRWVKASTKAEAKMENQVIFNMQFMYTNILLDFPFCIY